jgi:hypothetical protein
MSVIAAAGAHAAPGATFGDDVAFLKQHTEVITLTDPSGGAQVAVVPAYQGRVMTSAAAGADGASFGWLNREVIAAGKPQPHITVFGGEDRFWMGPEGGQFAIFFKNGAKFDLTNWQTPAVIDSETYDVIAKSNDSISFRKKTQVTNFSNFTFDVQIDRTVRLLDAKQVKKTFDVDVPAGVKFVGYATDNKITNTGTAAWKKETGLLSVWILGMFNASPTTTIVIPFEAGAEDKLGPKVNDTYFGKVPAERLVVKDNVLFFSADANYRSKIGLSPRRAKTVAGSYDDAGKVLTLVHYTKPKGVTEYVNSMWETQKDPFSGDVVNSYNDGPNDKGGRLGAFFELETSSPAAALAPNASMEHVSQTFHFQGDEKALDTLAHAVLGVGLDAIKGAFAKK